MQTTNRSEALARLEAAETTAQTLRESRQGTIVDAEMMRRLTADAAAARKAAEVYALLHIGDQVERLVDKLDQLEVDVKAFGL